MTERSNWEIKAAKAPGEIVELWIATDTGVIWGKVDPDIRSAEREIAFANNVEVNYKGQWKIKKRTVTYGPLEDVESIKLPEENAKQL